MIDDALQEQAALHALGMLRDEELRAFEEQCASRPELQALVNSLREMANGLAHALPPVTPPRELRESILGKATGEEPPKNVIPFPAPATRASRPGWKLAVAALLVFIPACLAVYFGMKAEEEMTARQSADRNAAALLRERDALITDKFSLTASRDAANASYVAAQKEIESMRDQSTKQTNELTALTVLKDKLDQEVKTLQARRIFDEAQIALLSPLPAAKPSKAVAVSLWNQKQQDGVFIVQNLPALKADRNYQLWVLDAKDDPAHPVPVSAGILTLDGKGGGRIDFKARKPIEKPATFAVTSEVKGEQETPDTKNMVLLGQ